MITFDEHFANVVIDDLDIGYRLTDLIRMADDALKLDLSKAIINKLVYNNTLDLNLDWVGHPPHVVYCRITIPVFPHQEVQMESPFVSEPCDGEYDRPVDEFDESK